MINLMVVHCSDSPDERDDLGAKDIHQWHLERGWSGIGYHYVIRRNGAVEKGRPDYWDGAHVRGHNPGSLGICLIGRSRFTDEQMLSLKDLLFRLKFEHQDAEICGHYELDSRKTCPNFNVREWVASEMPRIKNSERFLA